MILKLKFFPIEPQIRDQRLRGGRLIRDLHAGLSVVLQGPCAVSFILGDFEILKTSCVLYATCVRFLASVKCKPCKLFSPKA